MTKAPKIQIKFHEVISWLFSSTTEVPQTFIDERTKLNSIVPYLPEQLWTHPMVTTYLNEHTNDLFNIPDPIEYLKLLKKLVNKNRILLSDAWKFIPDRSPDLIKDIEDNYLMDENNARSKLMMTQKLGVGYQKISKAAPTKRNTILDNKEINSVVKAALSAEEELHAQTQAAAIEQDTRYIKELNQEVIDELGLVLFDISLLKKTNRVLYTFIDKSHQKKYYVVPFLANIFISKVRGAINNDYIEDKDPEKFDNYLIKEIGLYTKLKFMLGNSYKRTLNLRE